ncbi:MAG: ABC transporter ATP-binding protein [Bacillota bacterium]|jgi:oligopeptide/dipeptide ABC transporter ATP-binding protein
MSTLLEVQDLKKYFPTGQGCLHAVDGVGFRVEKGETLGLVGESGCGKSTLGRTILRLYSPTAGIIRFNGADITRFSPKKLLPFRRRMQIVFQDPFASLNPRLTVEQALSEPLKVHGLAPAKPEILDRVVRLLSMVELSPAHLRRYPHEFSGGQRQRIVMARALALDPELIVCDEPVAALDVSIQAQIINLLKELQIKLGLTYIFIAHDLSVVKHISHRVAVMYLGKIVEIAAKNDLYSRPLHPYTQALLSAVPSPNPQTKKERIILNGDVPSPLYPPSGCRFHTRCPQAFKRCIKEEPMLRTVDPVHSVACHLTE